LHDARVVRIVLYILTFFGDFYFDNVHNLRLFGDLLQHPVKSPTVQPSLLEHQEPPHFARCLRVYYKSYNKYRLFFS
jgi:hypothetical protein